MDHDQTVGARSLRRIADALGQPVEALFLPDGDEGTIPSPAEANALLAAFVRITSPQARRRIISTVETEAKRAAAL